MIEAYDIDRRMVPPESHSGTKVVGAVSYINDAVIVRTLAFNKRVEFLTCKHGRYLSWQVRIKW